jgi:hypothetical protein
MEGLGFVPGYQNDIFISYSHIDNDPIIDGKPGWVDFFEDLLRKRVRVRLGGEIKIFRDPQLRRYGSFSDQLIAQLSSSAVFICILSPRYIESDWCLRELEEFCKLVGYDRIIIVAKTAVDRGSKPEIAGLFAQVREVLDYRFYRKDESSGLFQDLQPEVIPNDIPDCIQIIDAIAQNLVELLRKLSASTNSARSQTPSPIKTTPNTTTEIPEETTVYLAETTRDLIEERNRVRTELAQFNCRVLPDQALPQEADSLVIALRDHLKQARLSVHLMGASYGIRPESEERSVPHIQYDVASEMSRAGQLKQLVWMPEGLAPKEESQQRFVEYVKNTSPEFLRTRLEDLKTEIQKKLKPPPTSGWEDEGEGENVNVCLFCHEQDMSSVGPLYSHLMVREMFRVKLPLKDTKSFESHKQLLQASDAVLLYYGTADEDWFVNIWRLIQRHISAGRAKPVLAKGIYAGQPSTAEKNLLESDDLVIIKNYGQFTPGCLTPFIARIRAAKGEAL